MNNNLEFEDESPSPEEISPRTNYGAMYGILTEDEIDYELGVHDCGQNPYCNRYRSCGGDVDPIPSKEKVTEIIRIGTERLLKEGFSYQTINEYFNERYK